jgi:histidine ammonia-lyase
MPAASFSRSTECHNQDKVSMGTIAARDCQRILELSEQVAAAALLASAQGLELRFQMDGHGLDSLSPESRDMFETLRQDSAFLAEDRALEPDMRAVLRRVSLRDYPVYAAENPA